MGDGVADVGGYQFGGLAGAALVAGVADVAGFAGEGAEALVAAVGAEVAGEAGGEVAAAVIGLDGCDGFRAEGTHGGAVVALVTGEEVIPSGVDDLPQREGAGSAGLVDGRRNYSLEQSLRLRSFNGAKSLARGLDVPSSEVLFGKQQPRHLLAPVQQGFELLLVGVNLGELGGVLLL